MSAWLLLALAAPLGCKRGRGSQVDAGHAAPAAAVEGGRSCHDNSACAPRDYCAYEPGLCGLGKRPGTCRPKPAACGEGYSPVCGCDGNAYDNECAAHAAGIDLDVMGHCNQRIPDWAPCGRQYCNTRTQYCEIFLSDVFELPTDYFCRALPSSCLPEAGVTRTCDCFPAGTRCLSFCGPLVGGGGPASFHLTCMGVKAPRE